MTITIHAIQTGSFQSKAAQHDRKPGGLLRVFTDNTWTD
jgi:hypothetical protein